MSLYYYFATTLPALLWNQAPGMDKAKFLEECERQLSAEDAAFVRESMDAFAGAGERGRWKAPERLRGTALESWYLWECCLRAELGMLRAQKLGRAFDAEQRPLYPDAQASAKTAFDADSPYEAERILSEARFKAAEQLRALHAWDREGIALYGVALSVAERHVRFTEEAGAPRYRAAYDAILETKDRATGDSQ